MAVATPRRWDARSHTRSVSRCPTCSVSQSVPERSVSQLVSARAFSQLVPERSVSQLVPERSVSQSVTSVSQSQSVGARAAPSLEAGSSRSPSWGAAAWLALTSP